MKTLLTTDWGFMRILRVVLGIAGIGMAVQRSDVALGIAGSALLLMGILNTGCCLAGSCGVPVNSKQASDKPDKKNDYIEYEEVK